MKIIIRASVLSILLFAPIFSLAQTSVQVGVGGGGGFFGISWGGGGGGGGLMPMMCAGTVCEIAGRLIWIINAVLVPLLFAVAFIVFIYGVTKKYILSGGDADAVSEGHKLILWGIIAFVVMISLWGIVRVVSNTFLLGGGPAPFTPTSY